MPPKPKREAIKSRHYSRDEKALLAHALDHLNANGIASKGFGGWYSGNRAQFVKRHQNAIALLEAMLKAE